MRVLGNVQYNILLSLFGVFVLFLICILINYALSSKNWRLPPQKCPDYWVEEEDGTCYNIKGLGTCLYSNTGNFSTDNVTLQNINKEKYYYMDFSKVEGGNTACNKQKWANGCGIEWDGITYGYGNDPPCK
jgi:hypothetical protein